jgi:hypothetical protein
VLAASNLSISFDHVVQLAPIHPVDAFQGSEGDLRSP